MVEKKRSKKKNHDDNGKIARAFGFLRILKVYKVKAS